MVIQMRLTSMKRWQIVLALVCFPLWVAGEQHGSGESFAKREIERVRREWKEQGREGNPFPFSDVHPKAFKSESGEAAGNIGVVVDCPDRVLKSETLLAVLHKFNCPVGVVAQCKGPFDLTALADIDIRVLHVKMKKGSHRIGSPESLAGLKLESFAWQGESWTNLSALAKIPTLEYICISNDSFGCDASPLAALPSLKDLLLQGNWYFREGRFSGKKLEFLSLVCNSVLTELPRFEGDQLESLELLATSVTNCSSIRNQPLATVTIKQTPVLDLSFVCDKATLHRLELRESAIRDLSPLKNTGLKYLSLENNPVDGYEPIVDLPLDYLIVKTNGVFVPVITTTNLPPGGAAEVRCMLDPNVSAEHISKPENGPASDEKEPR